MGHFLNFTLYGSWGAGHSLKIMSSNVGTISTIENFIPMTLFRLTFFVHSRLEATFGGADGDFFVKVVFCLHERLVLHTLPDLPDLAEMV